MDVAAIHTSPAPTIHSSASVDEAMERMDGEQLRHLAVVGGAGKLVGVISDRDLLAATGWVPSRLNEARSPRHDNPKNVGAITSPAHTATVHDSVRDAAATMVMHRIGCLPVLGDRGELVGLVDELDVLRVYAELWGSAGPDDARVRELMTSEVRSVGEKTTVGEALDVCTELRVRHLPLARGDFLVGIVSHRDLCRAVGEGRSRDLPLLDVVSWEALSIAPDAPASQAAQQLAQRRISSLPVVIGERLVGILTTTDLLVRCAQSLGDE